MSGERDAQTTDADRAAGRRLLRELAWPHRRALAGYVLVSAVETGAGLAVPYLTSQVLDEGIPQAAAGLVGVLFGLLVALGAAAAVQGLCRFVFVAGTGRIGNDMLRELRSRLFHHLLWLPVGFHDRYSSGRAVSRMTSDVESLEDLTFDGVDVITNAVLLSLGTLGLLFWLDWRLALVVLAVLPVAGLVARWFGRATTREARRISSRAAEVIVSFSETIGGLKAVQAFRREETRREDFQRASQELLDAELGRLRVDSIASPAIQLAGNVGVTLVLLAGGIFAASGSLSVGVLAAFVLAVRQLFNPLSEVGYFVALIHATLAGLEKIATVLAEPSPADDGITLPGRVSGAVRFQGVSFGYGQQPVLSDFSLSIPAGQRVALVGATGAGKSTVVKLLTRFYRADSGQILLDDHPLDTLAEETLRRQVAMVTQETFLFSGSVADNIALGRPDASRAEVEEAARLVGVEPLIRQLPNGYDTQLGSRGGRLSAGERQLVALARVLIADPPVVVLDEATSSLDIPSERRVQAAMAAALAGRTAVIIAHRLTTVQSADRVLVLDGGRIVEDGVPAELLIDGGHYSGLHRAWLASLA